MSSPWASSQAKATCAGVVSISAATARTSSTIRRLRSRLPSAKRWLVWRQSSVSRSFRERMLPVRKPRPSGEVRHEADTQFAQDGQDLGLRVAGPQGVFGVEVSRPPHYLRQETAEVLRSVEPDNAAIDAACDRFEFLASLFACDSAALRRRGGPWPGRYLFEDRWGEDNHGLFAEISADTDPRARLAQPFGTSPWTRRSPNSPTGVVGGTATSDGGVVRVRDGTAAHGRMLALRSPMARSCTVAWLTSWASTARGRAGKSSYFCDQARGVSVGEDGAPQRPGGQRTEPPMTARERDRPVRTH